eukprot:scaffold13589_cov64-Phaeocystis_antarctica.AAC.5
MAPLHAVPWDEADERAVPLVLLPLVHRADGADDACVQPVGQRQRVAQSCRMDHAVADAVDHAWCQALRAASDPQNAARRRWHVEAPVATQLFHECRGAHVVRHANELGLGRPAPQHKVDRARVDELPLAEAEAGGRLGQLLELGVSTA